jgi:hypothetical protein
MLQRTGTKGTALSDHLAIMLQGSPSPCRAHNDSRRLQYAGQQRHARHCIISSIDKLAVEVLRPRPRLERYSLHPLYTILAPYVSPFFSTDCALHSSTLTALTYRLGSTQKALLLDRAGRPPTAGTSMYLPV